MRLPSLIITPFYQKIILFLVIILIIMFLVIFIGSIIKSKGLMRLFKLFRNIGIILIVFFSIVFLLAYIFDIKQRFLDAEYTYNSLYYVTLEFYRLLVELKNLNTIDQELRVNLIQDLVHALVHGDFERYKLVTQKILMFLSKHHPRYTYLLSDPKYLITFFNRIEYYNYDNFSDIYYYCKIFVGRDGRPLYNI